MSGLVVDQTGRGRRTIGTVATVLVIVATGLIVGGCGSSADEGDEAAPGETPAPSASEFPKPKGQTVDQLASQIGLTNDYVAAPAGSAYSPGNDRFAFGMFKVDGSQLENADVAVYVSKDGGPAEGPFPARTESLETDAPFRARSTTEDPASAHVVYVADVPFDDPGARNMIAVIRNAGPAMVATTFSGPITVADDPAIPDVGDPAPNVDTPTVQSSGGDIESIDTRIPPDSMHDTNLTDVLGKKPVVLIFATPAYCSSRVCGPVVDVAEQVKAEYGDDVAFIHNEIYEGLAPPEPNKQVRAFGFATEPWLFVIDKDGKVSTRIEGAYSVKELEDAVQKVA